MRVRGSWSTLLFCLPKYSVEAGRNERLQFADHQASQPRDTGTNDPAVTPAPKPTVSTDFGSGMNQRRHMSHHALQAHIENGRGRFRFAADVEMALARALGDQDRGVDAFAADTEPSSDWSGHRDRTPRMIGAMRRP